MKKFKIMLGVGFTALALSACSNANNQSTTVSNTSNTQSTTSTQADDYEIKISTPNGAPLIAISEAVEASDVEKGKLKIVADTSTLPAIFQAGTEDIIVAPVNVGTNLYNAGKSKYKLASVITWGNTYFTSGKADFKLDDLNGKNITLFGKNSINDGIARYVLEKKGITANISYPETDVVASIKTILENNPEEMVMIAEPVLTVTKASVKNSKSVDLTSYSISNMYKELTNHEYPQAAIFVNPDSYDLHKNKFDQFFSKLEATWEDTKTEIADVAAKANSVGVPQPAAVLTKAIPGCGIKYVKASDAKADLAFAATEEGLKSFFGNKAPEDAFYLF